MPWDWDIDTQVSEATLFRLADDFNGTVVHYNTADPNTQDSYLLDVNTWARQRDRGNGLNIIDARWIDMQTGLYIDITGLSRLDKEKPNEWGCKNNHFYTIDDIYPLRHTTFEGAAAKVPFLYEKVLMDEYQEKALKETHYNHYTWNPALEEWISDEEIAAEEDKKNEKDGRQYE
ncbi:LicD family-domain-containing protein [Aspergillus egyptiacus]|nr:LicD family-domain-containing protein [Aspergillus egyptiacus]